MTAQKANSIFPILPVLVIGNFSHDTLIYLDREYRCLGGSAAYISAALKSAGVQFEGVGKVGQDFQYLKDLAFKPIVSTSSPTTAMRDDFRSGQKISQVTARCEPIGVTDLGQNKAKIGILGGVVDEILPETLIRARELCDVLICDLQGLIRKVNSKNQVFNADIKLTSFADLLGKIDYLKASEEEVRFIEGINLPVSTRLLVTEADRGSRLMIQGEVIQIPPIAVEEVDSSGAGDCFTAGFALGLLQGLSPIQAAHLGNQYGARAVSQVGVPDFSLKA